MFVLMLYVTVNIFQSCREDFLVEPGPEEKKNPCSTQLNSKFVLLISVKISTFVVLVQGHNKVTPVCLEIVIS